MTAARFTSDLVELDASELERVLMRFKKRSQNSRDAMLQLAEILRLYVEDNFADESSATKGEWPPLSAITLRLRRASRSPKQLQDTTILVQNIGTDASAAHAEVFTNTPYARHHIHGAELVPLGHQTGTWKLPSRDFFDIDEPKALEEMAMHLAAELSRGR